MVLNEQKRFKNKKRGRLKTRRDRVQAVEGVDVMSSIVLGSSN